MGSHGMGWDELQIPWDGMGWKFVFENGMGWDGTNQLVPWDDFLVPSHPIRSPDLYTDFNGWYTAQLLSIAYYSLSNAHTDTTYITIKNEFDQIES